MSVLTLLKETTTQLFNSSIKAFSIVKDIISVKKQQDPEILKQFKALHQSPELELKNLDLVLRKENQLSTINDKSRPKRPSKRARKAAKRVAATF